MHTVGAILLVMTTASAAAAVDITGVWRVRLHAEGFTDARSTRPSSSHARAARSAIRATNPKEQCRCAAIVLRTAH
jgi:hypothetical protein